MGMSKKDYVAIAEIVKQAAPASGMPVMWQTGCNSAREYISRHLADVMQHDNPRFDRERFLQACGTQ